MTGCSRLSSAEQVQSLNAYQLDSYFRPFTCPHRDGHEMGGRLVRWFDVVEDSPLAFRVFVQMPDGPEWFGSFSEAREWAEANGKRWLGVVLGGELVILGRTCIEAPDGSGPVHVWIYSPMAVANRGLLGFGDGRPAGDPAGGEDGVR